MRLIRPGRLKLRAEGGDYQNRQARNAFDDQVKQFARSRVSPLQILEYHQHGSLLSQLCELTK